MVGYRRHEGVAAARQLATLHERARLFANVFQASFKRAEKKRDGARVTKRYHKPITPLDRLLADPRVGQDVRDRAMALRTDLDPVRLLADIRRECEPPWSSSTGSSSRHAPDSMDVIVGMRTQKAGHSRKLMSWS
jgi:hypothetical protein